MTIDAFPAIRYFASGGILPETARSYLDHPRVFAVGATWMVDRTHLAHVQLDQITEAAHAAVALMRPEATKTDVSA